MNEHSFSAIERGRAPALVTGGRRLRRARNATPSSAPPSTSSPSAASSTRRSPTSRARPASPPAPSTSISRARTTCSSRSSSAACAKGSTDSRAQVADLARPARTAPPARARPPRAPRPATATSPSSSRSSCGSRRSSWSASRRRCCATTSASSARRSPTASARACFGRHQADGRGEDALRRARRDGDQLDPEPPPLFAREPTPTRSSISSSTARGHDDRQPPIRSVAVLGAGTMGAQIAAHFANAGVPVAAARPDRRRRARRAEARARAQARSVLHRRRRRARSRPAASTRDLAQARRRRLDHRSGRRADRRQARAARARRRRPPAGHDRHRRTRRAFRSPRSPKAAATTSAGTGSARTSSTRRATCGCSRSFRPPTPIRAVVERVSQFADHRLGKGVVVAKDTPNFIANHIGLYGVVQVLRALESGEYTIEEIDAITGPALGRPKSATFRTMDIAGIDVLGARREEPATLDAAARVVDRARRARLDRREGRPGLLQARKAGRRPGTEILTLDPATLTYRPRQSARLPSLDAARSIDDTGERIKTLFLGKDKVGEFLRDTLGPTLRYTAQGRARHRLLDRRRRSRRCGGDSAGSSGRSRSWTRSASAATRSERRRSRRAATDSATDGVPPAAPDLQILKSAKDRQQVVRRERRRQPRRSRRRRARRRVPLEDERDRRRHDPDAARRREGSRRELRGARRRQRRAELLRRRQPDAAAARSAGRQLGRDRPDGPRVPGQRPRRCATPTCRSSSRRPG